MTSSSSRINLNRFRTLALLTVSIIYLLILAGGIVRGTGSGMGCPDWPKCFGRWIPPTHLSQLPPNYEEIYGAKLKGEVEFNATKTWIEYINRLLGVLSGFFVFATLLTSLTVFKRDRTLFWGSLAAFLLIGANGWLGSKVVSTELAQYMITAHLVLALLVVFSLVFVWVRSNTEHWDISAQVTGNDSRTVRRIAMVVMTLTFLQLILGTEVRESLDEVVKRLGYGQRTNWISQLDWPFYVHRSFSLLVLAAHIYLIYCIRKADGGSILHTMGNSLMFLVGIEILTGVIMSYLSVPAFAQPIHLLLAVVLMGVQFMIVLLTAPQLLKGKSETVLLQSS